MFDKDIVQNLTTTKLLQKLYCEKAMNRCYSKFIKPRLSFLSQKEVDTDGVKG